MNDDMFKRLRILVYMVNEAGEQVEMQTSRQVQVVEWTPSNEDTSLEHDYGNLASSPTTAVPVPIVASTPRGPFEKTIDTGLHPVHPFTGAPVQRTPPPTSFWTCLPGYRKPITSFDLIERQKRRGHH